MSAKMAVNGIGTNARTKGRDIFWHIILRYFTTNLLSLLLQGLLINLPFRFQHVINH